ncbi:hypothetical protein Tcan_02844 [Toxocara canis]|uniref:Uncharacterized protein n=1 Tax=Toxocara canis TaxID=6265 RepID=A0A0B2VAA3_TOXCA|nr:hypothetical protein Tcan_02844 [Toxocara canis]
MTVIGYFKEIALATVIDRILLSAVLREAVVLRGVCTIWRAISLYGELFSKTKSRDREQSDEEELFLGNRSVNASQTESSVSMRYQGAMRQDIALTEEDSW